MYLKSHRQSWPIASLTEAPIDNLIFFLFFCFVFTAEIKNVSLTIILTTPVVVVVAMSYTLARILILIDLIIISNSK